MDWNFVIWSLVKIIAVIFLAVMPIVAYAVLAERKISAWIQDRVGPKRTAPPLLAKIPIIGPFLISLGIFQPIADGLKFILKEDFTPAHVRKIYFSLAPAIAMIPALMTVAVIPFGSNLGAQKMVVADLNVGVLYTFGIVSLSVYGIVLAGYASNSKYPFLGGIRSSAQMVSYELSMGMSVIPLFMIASGFNTSALSTEWQKLLAGTSSLNLSSVVAWQAHHGWLILYAPLSFIIFLVAGFAE